MKLMIHTLSQQTDADHVIISAVAAVIAAVLTAVLIRIKNSEGKDREVIKAENRGMTVGALMVIVYWFVTVYCYIFIDIDGFDPYLAPPLIMAACCLLWFPTEKLLCDPYYRSSYRRNALISNVITCIAVVVILFSPLEKHLCPPGSGFIEVDIHHLGYIVFGVEYLVLGVIMAVIIYRVGKAE